MLAGLGSIRGTLFGGILLGMAEAISSVAFGGQFLGQPEHRRRLASASHEGYNLAGAQTQRGSQFHVSARVYGVQRTIVAEASV